MALFQGKPFEDFDWNGKSTNETKLLEGPRLDCGRLRPICTSNRNQEKIFIPPVPSGATTYSDVLSLAALAKVKSDGDGPKFHLCDNSHFLT